MTEPFIYIASYRVKPGRLEDARRRRQQFLGTPPRVLTDDAREYDLDLDRYPTFVAGFTRGVTEGALP